MAKLLQKKGKRVFSLFLIVAMLACAGGCFGSTDSTGGSFAPIPSPDSTAGTAVDGSSIGDSAGSAGGVLDGSMGGSFDSSCSTGGNATVDPELPDDSSTDSSPTGGVTDSSNSGSDSNGGAGGNENSSGGVELPDQDF